MTKAAKKQTDPAEAETKRPEPTAKELKGSEIIIRSLEREGVEVIFGYPGGASMEIHQALTLSKKIRLVLPRHEQAGAFAAGGYARATGRPGVCLATSGPGATNLVTGIMDAKMDSIPVVAITGQVPTTVMGGDAFQETDIVGATLPCVKHSYLVKNLDDIPAVIHEAFHIASTGRPGPVLVDFPKDIQQKKGVPDFNRRIDRPGYAPRLEPSRNQIEKAAKLISQAKRPIIYAGGGIISAGASEELQKFVRRTQIPMTMTVMGLGCFPEDDPLCLRMLGMHGAVYANIAMNKADLVIALGVRFDDRVTGKLSEFCKGAKFIHVDVDSSEINKNIKVDVPIQGDVKRALEELNRLVKPPEVASWCEQIESWKKEFRNRYETPKGVITPQHVIEELSRFFNFHSPRGFLCSSGLGAMGFGFPAAIGAQVAYPNRTVVDIDGDGSFLMNVQELQTVRAENIPVKAVILNNKHLGMVAQWEDRFYESVRGHTFLGDADFAEIADAFGVKGATISKPEEVAPALKEMLAFKGPYILDVKYPYHEEAHGHVLPMIPGGRTYLDTILWDGLTLREYWQKKGIPTE